MDQAADLAILAGTWCSALPRDPLMLRGAALAVVAGAGIAIGMPALRRLAASTRGPGGPGTPLEAGGTATIEFVLVAPVLLFMILTLMQTMLVMSANLYVHYAAFAATRAAIVQVPRDLEAVGGEGPNLIQPAPGSPKYAAIRRAALFALVPIGGPGDGAAADADAYAAGLDGHYAAYQRRSPRWVRRLAPQRLAYAAGHTEVELLRAREDPDMGVRFLELEPQRLHGFGPKDPVTVRVEHRLYLSVPYARMIFADADPDDGSRRRDMLVRSQYTLTNEGIGDQLPPAPALPREP